MKRLDLENELYRRYILVSVTAYSAALLALPSGTSVANSENRAKRSMYKYILQKDLDDFKTFIDSNVGKIIAAWEKPNSYKRKCLLLITAEHQDPYPIGIQGFSAFKFYPGDATWGSCTWATELNRTLDKTLICEQFAFNLQSKRSSIRTKAETFWNPYKAKLSQSGSIYSTIKTMMGGNFPGGNFPRTNIRKTSYRKIPSHKNPPRKIPTPKIPIHQSPPKKIRTPKIPIPRTPRG